MALRGIKWIIALGIAVSASPGAGTPAQRPSSVAAVPATSPPSNATKTVQNTPLPSDGRRDSDDTQGSTASDNAARPRTGYARSLTEAEAIDLLQRGLIRDQSARQIAVDEVDQALADDTVHVSYAPYAVYGAGHDDVRLYMNQMRADYTDGMDAVTRWRIHWDYTPEGVDTPRSLHLTGNIVMVIPQLHPTSDASDDLLAQWHRYREALLFHESGHVLIAKIAMLAIRRRVEALPSDADGKVVNAVANQVVSQYQGLQDEYDRLTDHGATQGSSF